MGAGSGRPAQGGRECNMGAMKSLPDDIQASVDAAATALRQARRVLAITGAGLSADFGLPTYRGVGGLYEDSDAEDGVSIEVALSGDRSRIDPTVTW